MALGDLWLSLKETAGNLGVIAIIFIVIVVVIILVILIRIEKKLGKRIKIMEGDKNVLFITRVKNINQNNPNEALEEINKIAKDFFKERFKVKVSAEYSGLEIFFKKQNNKKAAEFCRVMNDFLYSGKKADPVVNQKLILRLINIIEDNPIALEEEPEKPQTSEQKEKDSSQQPKDKKESNSKK